MSKVEELAAKVLKKEEAKEKVSRHSTSAWQSCSSEKNNNTVLQNAGKWGDLETN